jgi:hypothetical protein
MVHCCYATGSFSVAKVWDEVFAHFHAFAVVSGIDCLAFQDEFFVTQTE